MSHYPLFFKYRDRIFGNGFVAEVTSHGRVLGVEEDGEIWIYGVEPGGLAAIGADPTAALEDYRRTFTAILVDLATDADSFEMFKTSVMAFFSEVNEPMLADWRAAVDAVRAGKVDLENVPRENADTTTCYVDVALKEQASFSPRDNTPFLERALAA